MGILLYGFLSVFLSLLKTFVNYEEILIIKVLDGCMLLLECLIVFLQVSLVKIANQTVQFVWQLPIVLSSQMKNCIYSK